MLIAILKQILLGIGISAGQALVETGQQLTIQTLQTQMAKMGVDIDPNSPLGMLLDNFKSNLGFQLSYELMRVSDSIMDSQIEKLREASMKNKQLIRSAVVKEYEKKGAPFIATWKNFFKSGKFINYDYDKDIGAPFIKDKCNSLYSIEDQRLSSGIDKFYKVRQSTGAMYQGLAVGSGVNNQAYNQLGSGISDDTRFFDAVQYLINMKKVG